MSSGVTPSGRVIPSADRLLVKLRAMIENRQFYEAHQLYRTLYFRYQNWDKFTELQSLLFEGAMLLLAKEQANSGADLANLYLDTVSKDPQMSSLLSRTDTRNQFYERIGSLYANIPANSNERTQFTINALKLDSRIIDIPEIHRQFALILLKEKHYAEARYHFIHSASSMSHGPPPGPEAGLLLIEYHLSQGWKNEVDLFITQFVLQLLAIKPVKISNPSVLVKSSPNQPDCKCLSDLSLTLDANLPLRSAQHSLAVITLKTYTSKHLSIKKEEPPFQFPLINFIWFLVLLLPTGDSALFKLLTSLYAVSLARDPEYKSYLTRIGEIYFGVSPPPPPRRAPGGIFGNLLQSLFQENDSGESDYETPPQTASSSRVNVTTAVRRTHHAEDLD